ncbi:hypothetical protein COU00_00755 [Candidatus Falkowbacteria bacterium CG10_big_fil_rev_8_21_14_0_10_43_11]|uniref:Uncharacterized protein n=1 Tax=Candidatus Falkowbacteria bacterium CG10_big_fil_rev_8_21_14_0_10_43_11 TaxID=1974568 RepID=A0A2M6WMU0_9BACT|nr:MAG: hypothetical protein COU00_00755 [Candidatus Falkowbacteria bacterium CG10_big_fil_rev_8_21_14_0_10_43_11]
MENQEPTNGEILEAINNFANNNEQRLQSIETDIVELNQGAAKIEATMVTKDYLDDKLSDLKGDLIVVMRKEDAKLQALVDVLQKRHVITDEDVKNILSLQPFPQIYA